MTTNKFTADIDAESTVTDMTVASKGGGEAYVPPPAGPCHLRFVGYVEVGDHLNRGYQGAPDKNKPESHWFFEVLGPKHKPQPDANGTMRPAAVVEIKLPISRNDKAGYFRLFTKMNYKGTAKIPAGLLGEAFKGTLVHRKYKRKDGTEGVALDLKNDTGYTIEIPRYEVVNPDDHEEPGPTGEFKTLSVAQPITPLKCLLWNRPTTAMWESIHIPGEYPARTADDGTVTAPAKSKNVLQEKIRAALNFKGSPISQLLATQGKGVETGPVEETTASPFEEPSAEEGDLLSGLN